MIVSAVNPKSNINIPPNHETCASQGLLFCLLAETQVTEIFLDPELPGHLRADDLLKILKKQYPEIPVSVITPETNENPGIKNYWWVPLSLCQFFITILLQDGSVLPPAIAMVGTLLLAWGGFKWLQK